MRGKLFEIVQLLEVAITDLAARLMTLPDQGRIVGFGIFLRGMDERRVPGPAMGASQDQPSVPVTRTPREVR